MTIAACPPSSPVVHGVVVFVPADFKLAYPAFAAVADARLRENFNLATLQLNNSCGSRVCDAARRETLLNLLVAHITQLLDGINGLPPGGLVGRVSDAQEGSVKAAADMGAMVYGQAYYMQTQYGAMYWQSTASYRSMQYVAPPAVCADLPGGGYPGAGYGGPWN